MWTAVHDADGEPGPAPGAREFRGRLRRDDWTDERPHWWLVKQDAAPVGWMHLAFPETDNLHAAMCGVSVVPGWRRRGIGRQLAAIAVDHARAGGRRVLIGECSDATPGPLFCADVGASPGVRSVRRLLLLDGVERERHDRLLAEAWGRAAGYSSLRWAGPAPDAMAAEVAALERSMNDAPMDDLDYGDEQWSVARLRRAEQNAADMALRLYQVAARHVETGELAGLTRIAVPEEHPGWAQQWDTVVAPAHRGHRVGLVVKLEMLRWPRDAEPALTTVETDNAGSNRYMIAVNEAIGFQPGRFPDRLPAAPEVATSRENRREATGVTPP